ncbi:glycosyltransferase family 39 protein [Actinokineospora terrae]|uniref:Dolichyl-phosphate-mannose-protein mannosyltransferase n=1 Tax=Actinokineospora terrae TaxID=155974 RepID=A0A1H9X8W5_9PSEU|nr:glycosyltransferase family 39 protein [Actinokineospora terrae]SES42638.1 Dolichyl-phosphate-mannose-protein mannosyltransferase [Actinokineospora terrae]
MLTSPSSLPSTSDTEIPPERVLAPIAWRSVFVVAGLLFAALMALAGRHGYLLDELYTRVAGQHLAWAQIDQPPLPALVARLETILFGDTVTALRVAPALVAAALVVLSALIAREVGGTGRAQFLAAAAAAASGFVANTGHFLTTNDFDALSWVGVLLLAIRMARTRNLKLWLAIGAVVGVGLYGKYLIALLLISLAVSVLVCGPRDLLRGKWLPLGVLIALVIPAPVLLWQAFHGWPQFEMAAAVSKALEDLAVVSFLPILILIMGLFLTPFWVAGLVALLRRPRWRPYRFVAVAFPVMIALLIITGGPSNYASALQFVLLAAGAVVVDGWTRTVTRKVVIGVALVANAALSAVLTLPVLPIQAYADDGVLQNSSFVQFDQVGWPELAAQAAAVYRSLPAEDQARAVFYGNHYGQAGALDRYGADLGLPRAYSGHNSYADFGVPTDDKTVVIAIGVDRALFSDLFASCEQRGAFTLDLPVSDRGQQFLVCRDPVRPWAQTWPRLRWIGFQCPYTTKPVTATSATGCD